MGLNSIPNFRSLGRRRIHTLDLSGNSFQVIPRHAFGRLSVRHLILSKNTATIGTIDSEAFHPRQRRSLLSLDLSQNHLLAVPECVRNLMALEQLDLHGNDITDLGRDSLQGLFNLTDLHIGTLSGIDRDAFRDVFHLGLLSIYPKALYVDNALAWLYFNPGNIHKLKNLETLIINSGVITFDGQFLGSMESLRHLEISRSALDNEQLNSCQITEPHGKLQHLNFAENRLKRIPNTFLRTLSGLEYLHLQHNLISRVPRKGFRYNQALRYIDLSHNKITSLVRFPLASLNHLEVVNLRNNLLQQISETDFPRHLTAGMEVFLAHNRWYCSCDLAWLMDLSLRQHLGQVGPLDVYEVENELACWSFINGTLLHEASLLSVYCNT